MYSTVFFLLFAAFYLFYNLSTRVKITGKPAFLAYLEQRPSLSKWTALSLALLVCILLIKALGLGAGVFGFVVALMGAGSLIVSLAPFRYFRMKQLLLIYGCMVIFEVFIF